MKDTLLNTFNPYVTLVMMLLLMLGSLTWTNKMTMKPTLPSKPNLKFNKFI